MQANIKLIFFVSLLLIAIIYLLILSYIYLMQEKMIFPSKHSRESSFNIPSDLMINIKNSSGIELEGIYQKNGSKKLLIWFEGNANNILELYSKLNYLGEFDVLGLNYQGYGKSGGLPSEKNIFNDALFLYDKFAQNYDEIYLLGRSLGTGVSVYLSSKRKVSGAVLITPYDSIAQIAQDRYKIFPINSLLKHRFESTKYLAGNATKFAVLEVKNDTVVPNKNSADLMRSIKLLTAHQILDNATHGEITSDERFMPFVLSALKSFE